MELPIDRELLYQVYKFTHQGKMYFGLLSYGKYSSRLWTENIRVATSDNGDVTYYNCFYPDKFKSKTISQTENEAWGTDSQEGQSLPLNGYVHNDCLTFHSRGSISAKTVHIEFDEKEFSLNFDELMDTDTFVKPTGRRVKCKFRL